jgi:CheY-like chemotaxis protein
LICGAIPSATIAGADLPAVLVVEDDESSQELMTALLRSRFEVLVADSGEEMRKQLEANGPRIRLLLMDLSLRGGEDGLMLTRFLRQQERWKNVPIIALTAHAMKEDGEKAIEAGCEAYVTKPFDHKKLTSLMR